MDVQGTTGAAASGGPRRAPVTIAGDAGFAAVPVLDPYLEATLWLLEQASGALVLGPDAPAAGTIHATNLLANVILLDGAHPGPVAQREGLGVILAEPSAEQLERLEPRGFHPGATWFLIPSPDGTPFREYQDAWAWAQQRPVPGPGPVAEFSPRSAAHATADPTGLLTASELWALGLRAGHDARWAAALRAGNRLRLIPRDGGA